MKINLSVETLEKRVLIVRESRRYGQNEAVDLVLFMRPSSPLADIVSWSFHAESGEVIGILMSLTLSWVDH